MTPNGKCLSERDCPAELAQPSPYACETPFTCAKGVKVSGGANAGESCRCLADTCRECVWRAGWESEARRYACTVCKKKMYLLEGVCIPQTECLAQGRVLVNGPAWPRGGVCAPP